MPELPEVETIRAGLEPLLSGREITAVTCHRQQLRYPLPDLTRLIGGTFKAVGRRSKYLLFYLDKGSTLSWHLGMTGQFHILPGEHEKGAHEHVRIDLNDGQSLRYRDPRRFGYAGLHKSRELELHPWFSRLGPEPLESLFDGDYLYAVSRGRKAPIKTFIMNASIVVGVGNIYASESLFRAGIHPAKVVGTTSKKRLALLTDSIREVLQEAVVAGGSTISDFVRADGSLGYFAHSFRVYGREGSPCFQCGRKIKRLVQGGRSSFYCSGCQR